MTKQNEKDAKRVPELRFKGFTDDWEQRKLGEIATIVGGGTPSTKNPEYWDGDINWYSPAEIGNQIYTVKSERQITELGLKKSSAKLLPVGTVLFTSRAGIGKTAILNKEACTNQGFQSIIPRPKILNSYFLFSRTNSLKQYGETMGSGSTFVEVSGKQMSKMPLFIPNINEQSKIAKLFQSLDKTITLHEEKHRQLERLKKALLQKMFADETGYPALRFKGFTAKWEQRKLGDITRRYDNLRVPVTASKRKHGDIPYYGANGIQDFVSGYTHDGEFILVAEDGARDPKNYPVNYVNGKIWVNNHAHVLQGIQGLANNLFLLNGIKKINIVAYLVGGSRAKLNAETLMQLSIKLPSIHEQEKIGQLFQSLDKTITLHDKKIQYLKQLKRGLLQKMFI